MTLSPPEGALVVQHVCSNNLLKASFSAGGDKRKQRSPNGSGLMTLRLNSRRVQKR